MAGTVFEIPSGMEWDQAKLLGRAHPFDGMLFSLIAFSPKREPKLVGTGFIIRGFGDHAIALTAAHVLVEAGKAQKPKNRYHPTALREFLPEAELVKLDRNALRAEISPRFTLFLRK